MSELPKILKLYCVDDTIAIMNRNGKEVVHWVGFDASYLPLAARKKCARRLVACWNACAGIETAELEGLAGEHVVAVLRSGRRLSDETARMEKAEARAEEAERLLDAFVFEVEEEVNPNPDLWPAYQAACAFLTKLNARKGG